jgi:coenzyme F420-reducing hydrogenase beta subunit
LKSYLNHHPAARRKVKVVLSLFCGHLSTEGLTNHVINQMRPKKEAELVDFRYRSGHWRGKLTAKFDDNSVVERPFSFFSDYQNLNFFLERKCLHCFDHTGYYSDISLGDIWLQEMKDEPIKHSAVIAKTKTGFDIIEKTAQDGDLTLVEKPISLIAEGQSRSLKIHYNISARAKAGYLLGVQINDHVNEKVRWVNFIIAYILIFNHKLTQSSRGKRLVCWMPRPLIKGYLYFLKGLEIL